MKENLIIIAIVILVIFIMAQHDWTPVKYRKRGCMGKNWKERFPSTPKEDIRAFLDIIMDAFWFPDSSRLKFTPDDVIMDIYRKLHPPLSLGDDLELETLALHIKEKYNLEFEEIWRTDLTLGELFSKTHPNHHTHSIAGSGG